MENVLESAFFQKELRYYGLSGKDVRLIRSKEGVITARVRLGEIPAVLKCFENLEFRREIKNYEILQSCAVPTLKVLGKSDCSILLEDIRASDVYRLGAESDLHDPAVIRAIAKWYKTLHTNGSAYVRQHGVGMYEEWDCFTMETIRTIREKFDLAGCAGLQALINHFQWLRAKMDAAPRTITYNDFYYTNLAVKKDASEALMFDYNLLGKGNCVSDIQNVTYWFSEENKAQFFRAYGDVDKDLLLLDRICAPVVALYSAAERGIFPDWAKGAVDDLGKTGELIDKLRGFGTKRD